MLGDGQIDDLVGFEKRRKDRPAFQHHAAHVHLAEMVGIGQNDFGALGARRRLDARALKAAARLVAAHVGDDHALGAGLPALPHHLRHQFGIGVGRLLRRAVPRDVRLEHHHVLAADKAAHPAQVFERLRHERARLGVLRHGHLRPLRVSGHAMIAARLLGLRGNGTAAVLAEPDARACRARGHPAQRAATAASLRAASWPALAAPRPASARRFTGFACSVCFAGHAVLLVRFQSARQTSTNGCVADRWFPAGARRRQRWRCSAAGGPQPRSVGIPASARLLSIICHAV